MIQEKAITGQALPDWRSGLLRLEGAYAPHTIRSYCSDAQIFIAWCEQRSLVSLAAEAATVCAFLEDEVRRLSVATVKRRLCAIRKLHRLLHLPDPTRSEEVQLSLRRIRRAKPSRPKQARGMTSAYLARCLAAQPDTPWGLRNRAMLSLGYDLLTRRSELVALRTGDIEFRKDGMLRALIRRSKADQFGMGRLAFGSRRSAMLLREWLDWRGEAIDPLFCGIYHGKPIARALCTSSVKQIIKEAVAAAGLAPEEIAGFSGHSLRVGAAQDLLRAGHDTAAIMRAGGWKSVNVLGRYLELAEHNVWA